ncbi:MAG: Gldg family protein [Alphaproteobacteria bacterium]
MAALPDASRANLRVLAFAGLVLAVVLFLAVNILARAGLSSSRLDLTEDKLFTLSPGTYATLAKIDEPVTLRFYYSPTLGNELPNVGKYATRVRDVLKEYAAIARGKIRLEIIEPVPFSDAEDQAVAAGLQGLPLDRTGEMVYFGLAGTNSTDDEERVAFFSPDREAFLEYDLTKLVHNLANPKRKTIGLMTALPVKGFPGTMMARLNPAMARPWQMLAHLQQLFDLKEVPMDTAEIPAGIDVLLVAHPAEISPKAMYAIDQFVLGGGRVVALVDPVSEVAERALGPGAKPIPATSSLKPLFDAWGVELAEGKIAGDATTGRRVNAGTDARPQAVEYPVWQILRAANFSSSDLIASGIDVMQISSPGALSKKEGGTTDFTPLIQTSEKADLIDADKVMGGRPDFQGITENFKPTGARYTIAARVSGPVKTAFPDGFPKEEAKDGEETAKPENRLAAAMDEEDNAGKPKPVETPTKPQLMASNGPIQAVIIADTDLLQDRFWVQMQDLFGQAVAMPLSNNMDFVTNALDNLTGSNDLIGLRSRGISQRPFERVEALQREAETRLRAKERELQARREETEKKIADLQRPGQAAAAQGAQVTLSPAQQEEIEKFKAELLSIRRDLRGVQLDLRRDIERLKTRLWFFDIAAIPLLVALFAIGLGVWRMRRRRAATIAAKG